MAGGEGTRLRPLTSNQPKPMVPIVGKPCMEHILELLRLHGFEDVVVTVAFLPQAIRSYFGDGTSLGINIQYSVEETPLGTAGSVRLASDALDDTFLVISGDALCDIDLKQHRRVPQAEGRRGHDRAEVGREPARVRDRGHGRRREGRALPREAVVGAGLLRHDQHRHLRARARGAAPHPDRPPVRLLEGALPAAARDGAPDLRLRVRRLLAGHRQPRAVPPGELRRARREGASRHHGPTHSRRRVDRRRCRDRRRRRRRGAGVHRQLRAHLTRGVGRPVHGARAGDDAARARPHLALGARRVVLHRPQRDHRRRDHRPQLRHPSACAHPRRRCDRRPGDDRRPVGHLPRCPDLPVQGSRLRSADPREPDLGVARHDARVRTGRRRRARQRRSHAGDRAAASAPHSARR